MPETVWILRKREGGWVAGRWRLLGPFETDEAAMRTVPVDLDTVRPYDRGPAGLPGVGFADVVGNEYSLDQWEVGE